MRITSMGKSILWGALMLSPVAMAQTVGELQVSSPAFEHKGKLPKEYSCNGKDISPPLVVGNIPAGAKSLVLIHDDPDARDLWDHWVLYNIPVTGSELTLVQDAPKDAVWEDGTMMGLNGWGNVGYGGACPPDGTHRYYFRFYALDTVLDLKQKRSSYKVKRAMKKHILAKGQIMAKYP